MFRTIQIAGLGPLDGTFEIHPGETTVSGRSQVGKSSLLTSLCFCLWGTDSAGRALPVEAITDGEVATEVVLQTSKGTKFYRSMSSKRKTVRELYAPGEDHGAAFRSERDWHRDALKPLGRELQVGKRRVSAGRLIAAPFVWEELANSAGGGRELRDALDLIVGGGEPLVDVVKSLMDDAGEELWKSDPLDLKGAEAHRSDANRAADQAEGAKSAADDALRAISEEAEAVAGPSPVAIEKAEAVLTDARTWTEHDEASKRYQRDSRGAANALLDWKKQINELGTRPTFSSLDEDAAAAAVDFTQKRLQVNVHALTMAKGTLSGLQQATPKGQERARLNNQLSAYREHEGKCPECRRKWAKSEEIISALTAKLSGDVVKGQEVIEAESEVTRLAVEVETAEKALESKERTKRACDTLKAAAHSWDAARRRAGEEPESFTGKSPIPPDLDRPTDENLEFAEHTLRCRDVSKGASSERANHLERAKRTAATRSTDRDVAKAKALRAAALVDAVRRAPSERLRRSIGSLGDTGPVSFRLPAAGDGVEVLIDGRPHGLASRGRRIYADLVLRLTLRRALRMTWFPVFVDDAQCWSGGWPETREPTRDGGMKKTPVIYLHTADVALDVREGSP